MSKSILLVEDNSTDEKLTLHDFKKGNIDSEIVVVRDGAEALAYLFDPTTVLPTLVLLDLNLPRVSGLDVLRKLRAHESTQFLPVVILTASKEEEDLLNSYSLGANAYVRKPIEFADFVEAAKTLGLFWLLLNEPAPGRREQL